MAGRKLIARIKGGIGNQLFMYAAARRLALVNDAELVLDHVTGFSRDKQHRRAYALDRFDVVGRLATPAERMEPLPAVRHLLARRLSGRRAFGGSSYVEQRGTGFEKRLLDLRFDGALHLEGYWQSEKYFADIESLIREEIRLSAPQDRQNRETAAKIADNESVALHVRWFRSQLAGQESVNVAGDYYGRALDAVESSSSSAFYFVFSDDPQAARANLNLPPGRHQFVEHNQSGDAAFADLWLMRRCTHFITANSTFSWWAAWLGEQNGGRVLVPHPSRSVDGAWASAGMLPDRWRQI